MNLLEQERAYRRDELIRELDCYSITDLEVLTDLSTSTLAAWRNQGKGPAFVMLGRTALYPRSAVQAFIQECLGKRHE
ncbi:hypothetical protein C5F52_10295 [Limnohabitans sp. TS-CS-82]|uniref:helix-turn-helix domain-containing protein n=1 Tax=Limnohabitans sp. TS-CS-82 TaxID=2094193 RepID=UPI000CF291FF|nr:helix-turn-helix domain-containing protein [Limnohabitans sp. TS-CS-82]PQA83096.1 hypothetical protein C5F52_10295 [Limnohabitans sp. TS-CS-82]